MAKYAVLYEEEKKEPYGPGQLEAHLGHLSKYHAQGLLGPCGPLKDSDGKALLIFEADSKEEVERCIAVDPFIVNKRYAKYWVFEWLEASDKL